MDIMRLVQQQERINDDGGEEGDGGDEHRISEG